MSIFFFIVLYCFVGLDVYAQDLQPSQTLRFDERVYDFGQIAEADGEVCHEFAFINSGDNPIFINGVSMGCSCVRADYPKDVIRPGKRGVVKICYNPAYRPGFFSKEIVILSNNNAHYNRIWVKGTVNPCAHPVSENYPYEYGEGLWMNLEVVAFGTLQEGESKTMKLKFANDTDKDFDLMFVVIGGNKDIHFTSPRLVKAHGEGVMPIIYQNSGKYAERTRAYPVVNGKVLPKPLVVTRIQ